MPASVRFVPAQCPECGTPVAIGYAEFQQVRRHPLFVLLLILGVAGGLAVAMAALGGVVALLADRLEGLKFKLRVAIYLLAWMGTLPVIGGAFWLWWRFLDRLPRKFAYECRPCQWSGTVRAFDVPFSVGANERVEQVESDGHPMEARRERQQRRMERERRQARAQEHESPPNPDFDFRGE